ncbi:Cytochrome oxidase assembly protein [Phytophthora cinnamomi]|uniref:Cytochrome oxidase assembly protein n=1 Tax=Phytophthora cinnamomi TaxID=4785 RepID=UPI003559CD26|nr:Cytochrome oxidase assembly protein [Phytophthora cinnamomi]
MRSLRLVILIGALLELTKADIQDVVGNSGDVISAENDEDESAGAKLEDDAGEEVLLMEDEGKQSDQEFDDSEALEAPAERKLYPYEQRRLEAELRWQRDTEEWERREREEAMRDQVTDDKENPDYPEEQYEQNDRVDEDDDDSNNKNNDNYDAYFDQHRRLDEQGSDQPADGDEEEEIVPVVPGLTDVELFAFNAEFANEEVLDKIIDWSYDQVAAMSRFRDNYIHVEDLYDFLLKTLNPLDEAIDEEDEVILTDAVTELRRQQGLVDKEQVVYRGFIARGMPLRFLQSLAHDMHQTVQKRRLQASAGRDEL